jgi:hypothetical protein
LFTLLVLGLQQKQAVALQINAHEFVLFNEGGVTKHGEHDNFVIPKGAWTLSDSESLGPCSAFRFSKGHLLYTSSPASGRWMEWAKQFGAMEYVMDIWSQAEFQTLLYVQLFSTMFSTDLCFTQNCFRDRYSCWRDTLSQIRVEYQVHHGHSQASTGGGHICP